MKALTISLAFSLQILVCAVSVQGATLAWKFTPGDEQQYRLTQSSRITGASESESKQIASVEQVLDLKWKLLEVADSGDAKVSLEVTAFSMLARGPGGQEVQFDSHSREEPQGYAAMLAPIGKRLAESPITFVMSPRGEVSDIQLPEELADAVKSVPGGKKFAQDSGLASIETMARLGAPLNMPEGEVQAEQTWSANRSLEMPVLGDTKVAFTYKVAAPVSEDEVTIEQQMALAPASEEPAVKLADERSTGTIVWDAEAGRPETSVLTYEVEIEQPTNAEGSLKLEQNTEFRRIADETQ